MVYNIIFILLLYLSYNYDFHGHKNGRKGWYYAILVFFILFAGLRWRLGIDTPNYIEHFYYACTSYVAFSYSGEKRVTSEIIQTVHVKLRTNELVKEAFGIFVFEY